MHEFGSDGIKQLWSKSDLNIWDGFYRIVAFEPDHKKDALVLLSAVPSPGYYCSMICDNHEVAVILPDKIWQNQSAALNFRQEFGPLKCITFDVPLDIEVSGYLKPAISALADAGVSVIPQCALIYDHILVHETDLKKAKTVLNELKLSAKE